MAEGHGAVVILGIACTVIISGIALYQHWMVGVYRKCIEKDREVMKELLATGEQLNSSLRLYSQRLKLIADALPLHQRAAQLGDARACSAILATAIHQGNQLVRSTSGTVDKS